MIHPTNLGCVVRETITYTTILIPSYTVFLVGTSQLFTQGQICQIFLDLRNPPRYKYMPHSIHLCLSAIHIRQLGNWKHITKAVCHSHNILLSSFDRQPVKSNNCQVLCAQVEAITMSLN